MQYDDGCETFYSDGTMGDYGEPNAPGWYWWSCQPGCIPDSDFFGPFETEEEARDDYLI